jgi:hypothetical protein
LAAAGAEVLAAKYKPAVKVGQREVFTAMNQSPSLRGFKAGAQNPDDLASKLGVFVLQPEGGHDQWFVRFVVHNLGSFGNTARQIHRACGCSHVLVVTRWPPPSKTSLETHTMVAKRWLWADGNIQCDNTHGYENGRPEVDPGSFVKGFWVDAVIVKHENPTQGGFDPAKVPLPQVSAAWEFVRP